MPILEILKYPDPRLLQKAAIVPLEEIQSAKIQHIIDDMFATLYHSRGVGLAATQVNIHLRIVVIDVSPEANQPLCLINPEILIAEGEAGGKEGCLSVPGDTYEEVIRAKWVKMQALDRNGTSFIIETEGLLAKCIQHELDHLEGIVFLERLPDIKRDEIKRRLDNLSITAAE